jgi:hypothetical protein
LVVLAIFLSFTDSFESGEPILNICTPRFAVRLSACAAVSAIVVWTMIAGAAAYATPANRIALVRYYGRFLPRRLDACTTCHLPSTTPGTPASLKEFPHNAFGKRLAEVGQELAKAGKKADIVSRLKAIAHEDSDGDGVDNETELLLGHAPGDPTDRPTVAELADAPAKRAAFARYLASYRWQPFEPVRRPTVPRVADAAWSRNPIDAFLAREYAAHRLKPRPEASKAILLRRVSIDLTGLVPTPEELRAFLADASPNAYEKVVDRLLASPRYGERWGRHWMDVWRYSDWAGWADGNQIRDSKPHIWRWRDWIVESLNRDKGYDRMVQEMLAADELCPEDADALRATGFLVRNYKLLSREQWLEDTVGHTAKAFLGLTMHCAKCHDHMYAPITQREYYRMRAIFEPHNVRTDRVPGQLDTGKDGLVRAYDADLKVPTYLFIRGDERHPDKDQLMTAGVPAILGGAYDVKPVQLPALAAHPDRRDFVYRDLAADAEMRLAEARKALAGAKPEWRLELELGVAVAETQQAATLAMIQAERLENAGQKLSDDWKRAATATAAAQRRQALLEARLSLLLAQNAAATPQKGKDDPKALQVKVAEAQKAVKEAEAHVAEPPTAAYKPRSTEDYPAESTGRRLAFARWLTDPHNPLTARVAVNHIWARHFGEGIVPTLADFGRNGRPPTHPQLLDWLAAELMANGWRMKPLHRLMVTSRAYRMASTPDAADLSRDPDNAYLWRMNSRRMEAEAVRDNVLYLAGSLDETMGGPEIDHNLGLTSRRRSLYLRLAAEKEVPFLKLFDGPSVTECYERQPSVMPQQALALANSELTLTHSKFLAASLQKRVGSDPVRFVNEAFVQILSRAPTPQERALCLAFLAQQTRHGQQTDPQPAQSATTAHAVTVATPPPAANYQSNAPAAAAQRARENLVLVLFNHNDFVTVR